MNKGTTGLLTELMAQQRIIAMGASVLTPVGAETPFDLVVHIGGRFSRVQIKTGWINAQNVLRFQSYRGAKRKGLTSADCDVLLVYCRETSEFFVFAPNGRTENGIHTKKFDAFRFTNIGQLFPETIIPPRTVKGVIYRPRLNRWEVRFVSKGVTRCYGSHPTYEAAVIVLERARRAIAEGLPFVTEGGSGRVVGDVDHQSTASPKVGLQT